MRRAERVAGGARSAARALAALAIAAILATAQAAEFVPDPVDMAAAKSEGSINWYTSTPIEPAQKIAKLFETETGIKVQLFRTGGSALLSRFLQEVKAGRIAADMITNSDAAAAVVLARQGLFVPFKPRNFDKIPDEVKDRDGSYIAQRLQVLSIFVRGDKLAPEDRPKSWSDLLKPKYKGMEVLPDPSFTSLQFVAVATLSRKLGWAFYEGLQRNDAMIVQSNQQVTDALKRGERLIAAMGADNYADEARKEGHNILTIYPADGALAVASPTAIVKGSPHPNAAKAFAEFMIGDAVQTMFPADGIYAARIDIAPPPGSPKLSELTLLPIDYDYIEKESANIKTRFNETFQ